MRSIDELESLRRESAEKPLTRRGFLRALTIAGAGTGVVTAGLAGINLTRAQRAEAMERVLEDVGKLKKHSLGNQLGGMKVTPMCICSDWNRDLYAPGLAAGINFVHKAGYWASMPEEFKSLPRESYYTDITVDSTPNHPDDEDGAYNQVTTSLDKNGLKYYDIFRAHYGWRSLDAFKNKTGTYKAFQRLQREGKVKYFGVSQHASNRDTGYPTYPEIIAAEIESGLVHSMQVWYTHDYPKDIEEVFAKASAAGIGMTAMKICAHGMDQAKNDQAFQTEMKAPGMPARALIRSVLSTKRPDGKPIFQTCVSQLRNEQHFEENVGALSHKVALADGYDLEA